MPRHTPGNIRNIAITGHAGAGKTTLIERLLAHAGVIGKCGTVEDGNTVCDFEPEEKSHKHSLYSSLVHFDRDGTHLNIIDTPGFPDFIGQAISVFPAVETVAVVIGADKGIQATTRRMMAVAQERNLPRMIIINKIDEHIDDLEALVAQIQEQFGTVCLPLNLPTPDGKGVVDVWEKSEGKVAFSSVNDAHQQLVDQSVEADEQLMTLYLEQGSLTKQQLHDAFEASLTAGHLVPIVFTSARDEVGIDELLDVFSHLCPTPEEGNPRPFQLLLKDETAPKEWFPKPDPNETLVAHIFKVTTDQFVGKIALARIHQGTIKAGDQVYINDGNKAIRLAHLHKVNGKEHTEVDSAVPGDIIAITKHDEIHINDVLHASNKLSELRFKPLPMPRPMYGLAIEAKARGEEAKISNALHKLVEEDPTFIVERINATRQTVARAMGELHMRVILERLHNRFKLELDTHPPKVAYKETITAKAEGHHRHKKQTGGAGQFGEVYLRVEPLNGTSEAGLEFVDATVGGSIPRQFLPAIEKGIKQAMIDGAVAGYPLSGVRVEVYDGKYHAVDSKEVAFITAGKRAFIDAVRKAKPVILEPFVEVEVSAPATSLGDITADFSSKRAHILDTEMQPGDMCLIRAKAPLSEMGHYSSQLKSMTSGQGTFVMDYSHDETTPPNVQQEIIAAYKPDEEED